MKTIIRKETNLSLYIFEDDEIVDISDSDMKIGNPVDLIVFDCNSENVSIIENVNPPNDWEGNKYSFDGTNWTVTQEWIDANTEVIEPE